MAQRRAEQARRKAAPARVKSRRPKGKAAARVTGKDRLEILERECEALRGDLERAQARCLELEKTQSAVRDRISWALDSLHNILNVKD
jgi:hypothetical protein